MIDAQAASEPIDVVLLVGGLLGGLAIFLLGMDRMTESLRVVAGDRLRNLLARLTSSRFVGMVAGAGITAVIQSSSITTVLVVGFISSGLMSFEQSLSVIIGANIGTTVTAQIIAFRVTTIALYAMAGGFLVTFFSKRGDRQAWGAVVLGLGLVFFGMSLMGDAMSPLRSNERFIDVMAELENPFLGIGVGAAFTALVQSSSATTAIVIVLAQQGLISLETGIALALGANVGTAVTAILASAGKPREAMRAGAAHAMFNIGGVLLWLPFLGLLASLVEWIGGGSAREVANAHTIFNLINAFAVIGFVPAFARLIIRLVPDRPEDEAAVVRARYLDRTLLKTPSLALDRARLEMLRMADRVRSMLEDILPATLDGSRWVLLEIAGRDDEVDSLHKQIITYLGEISQTRLSDRDTEELLGLMEATNDLEAIGDLIETNLVTLGMNRIEQALTVSPETSAVLIEFHAKIAEALDLAMLAITQKNEDAARGVSGMKREVNSLERAAAVHQAERLVVDAPDRIANYRLEVDVISALKRIFYFTRRMARSAIPAEERAGVTDD